MKPFGRISLVAALVLSFTGTAYGKHVDVPPRTVNVPREVPTIQQGIDLVADGGKVVVQAGVFEESLRISKNVRLIGPSAGRRGVRAQVAGPERRPVITIVGPVRVAIKGFRIHGGNGVSAVGGPVVRLTDVLITDSADRGISGEMALEATRLQVANSRFHGIHICSGLVQINGSLITNNQGAGLVLCNFVRDAEHLVKNSTIALNQGGGVQITGGAGKVVISMSSFISNRGFGVFLNSAQNIEIALTHFIHNQADTMSLFGDGVFALGGSTASLTGTHFLSNDRVGLASTDSSVITLAGSHFQSNAIDLDNSLGGTFVDQGGNFCWTSTNAPECNAISANPEPPDPF